MSERTHENTSMYIKLKEKLKYLIIVNGGVLILCYLRKCMIHIFKLRYQNHMELISYI